MSEASLTRWAEECLSINHLNTQVQREIEGNNSQRALALSERARRRAWKMLNEMYEAGASKPEDYCEPDPIIMDRGTAQAFMKSVSVMYEEFNRVTEVIGTVPDERGQRALRMVFGGAISQIITLVERPIVRQFPDLDPEKKVDRP